jgi:hypothetical protein
MRHETSSHDVPAQGVAASALITLHTSANAPLGFSQHHWPLPLRTLELLKPVLITAPQSKLQ